ncbi:hypothetical protein ACSZM0_20895 [Aeromonas hydrophila]
MTFVTKIIAPSHICIYGNIEVGKETVRFFSLLLKEGHDGPLVLDLRRTLYVSGAAAVMLFAHVNFLQLKYGSKDRVRCLVPSKRDNPEGHYHIVGTQLSRALMSGTLASLEQLVADEVPFQSSNNPTSHANVTVEQLTRRLNGPHTQLMSMLGSAISEAVLNVKHHAYQHDPEMFSGCLESRWWQYARFDEQEGRFLFVIYDLGLGILQTYRNSLSALRLDPDTHIMEEALSFGYSRFSETNPERGCGSEDIKHPVRSGELLLICCDDLRYIYEGTKADIDVMSDKASGRAKIERTFYSVNGNLLEWTFEKTDGMKEAQ